MKHLLCSVLAAALFFSYCIAQSSTDSKDANATGCKSTAKTKKQPRKDNSIGTATMTSDGTIILDLRAKNADGTIGESRLVYPKNHKQYSEIMEHLGGIKPGESKPVPPWPNK